jgi:hypothetical protein
MIKREVADTIPLLHVAQQFDNIEALLFKSKRIMLFTIVHMQYTPDSALVY